MIIYDLETRSFAKKWSNKDKALAALGGTAIVGNAVLGAKSARKKMKERAEEKGWDPTRTKIAMTRATYRGALRGAVGTGAMIYGGSLVARGMKDLKKK